MKSKNEEVREQLVQEQKPKEEGKETPNALLISVELAEALGKYLMTKPMNEVEPLVSALRSSRAVTVTDNKESEE